MANYKKALEKLEEEKRTNIKDGCIKDHDLEHGQADIIIKKRWEREDKQWKVEYAKEIIKEFNKECEKASK